MVGVSFEFDFSARIIFDGRMETALDAILKRRAAIDAEVEFLRQRIALLEKERPDLEAAERVLRRLAAGVDEGDKAEEMDTGKPDGIPPVSEMILLSLAHAHRNGQEGLTPQGLLEVIRSAWWPNVTTDSVGPIAWRMWKNSKLGKEGSMYFRLDRNSISREMKETPTAMVVGVSKPEDVEGGSPHNLFE